MTDDIIMLLIRIGIIVIPAAFASFIAGYIWGRGSAYRYHVPVTKPPAIDTPDPIPEVQTIVTRRNRKVIVK
jgi:hypothetical protein